MLIFFIDKPPCKDWEVVIVPILTLLKKETDWLLLPVWKIEPVKRLIGPAKLDVPSKVIEPDVVLKDIEPESLTITSKSLPVTKTDPVNLCWSMDAEIPKETLSVVENWLVSSNVKPRIVNESPSILPELHL